VIGTLENRVPLLVEENAGTSVIAVRRQGTPIADEQGSS
jgi:hypothetical protein